MNDLSDNAESKDLDQAEPNAAISCKRLHAIANMTEEYIDSSAPILHSTYEFLRNIQKVALNLDQHEDLQKIDPLYGDCITIFCGASYIKGSDKDSKDQSAFGYIIDFAKKEQSNLSDARFSNAETRNQAEYDAIYFGLSAFIDLCGGANNTTPINIISDSESVIDQLKGEKKCHDKKLKHKRDSILELVGSLLYACVTFSWKPRNCIPKLKKANNIAQNLIS